MLVQFKNGQPCSYDNMVTIQGNNLVDLLEFKCDTKPSFEIDSETKIYLKVSADSGDYSDKLPLEVISHNPLHFSLILTHKTTKHKLLSAQIIIEKDEYLWQLKKIHLHFFDTVKADEEIEEDYPTVLESIEKRLDCLSEQVVKLDKTKGEVYQYQSKYNFPNIGKRNSVYIDADENKAYRYDVELNKYYIVGSDYEDIKIINGNGGK